jgi:hypothetical protein
MPETDRQKIYKALVTDIKERQRKRRELDAEVRRLENTLRQKQLDARWAIVKEVAAKLNVDMEDVKALVSETYRKHRVEGKMLKKAYAGIEKKAKKRVKEEIQRKKALRRRYLQLHGKAIKARSGNPELKFMVAEGHWDNSYPPDRGMTGWGIVEPDNGGWNYETATAPDYDFPESGGDGPNHMFYPRARVDTGDNDSPMTLELEQVLVLSHSPLAAGRGRFTVERVRVDLSGDGLSQARMGDACGMGHNWWVNTEMWFSITASQFDPTSGLFLSDEVVADHCLPMGSGTHTTPVSIELGTAITPYDAFIDNSGADLWLYFDLRTKVSAADKNAFSEINFSEADSFGLRLGCITLIGSYAR